MQTHAPASPPQRNLNAILIAAFLGWMFDGFEMGIFPLVARPALQQMQVAMGQTANDVFVGSWTAYITAAFLVGAALGGVVFGWLGDRFGRVRAMSLSILCYSLCTALTYFAQTPEHLVLTRFLAALGMGGEWSLGVALVMEAWPEKHRAWLAGVIGAAANLGFALVGLMGLWFKVTTDSWRWVALVGAAPAVLIFFIRLFVPESPRWEHAANTAGPARPLREIFAAGIAKRTLLAALFCGIMLVGTWGSIQWLPLWADQLTGGTMPKAKAMTQICSAFGAVTGSLVGAWLGGLGRRPAYFLICLTSVISCAALFRGVDAYGTAFLTMTFIAGLTTASFYGWAPLYLPELFPTRIRATGQGFAYNAGRIFAAVGTLQMPLLMREFDGSYARAGAVVSLVYLAGTVLIWLAPETKGKPLPE
jgi:MFS transporter, SHS family, sialic acid transporter